MTHHADGHLHALGDPVEIIGVNRKVIDIGDPSEDATFDRLARHIASLDDEDECVQINGGWHYRENE